MMEGNDAVAPLHAEVVFIAKFVVHGLWRFARAQLLRNRFQVRGDVFHENGRFHLFAGTQRLRMTEVAALYFE